jgi:quercetin dioxygenase-like cupin family protein
VASRSARCERFNERRQGEFMQAQPRTVVHSDIKPENRPELASRYIDAPGMPWEKTKFPGIAIKVLYSDDDGITTALFKLDPGAVVPLHEHTALEQTFVLEGTIEDHEGACGPGQFVWRPAGNRHEAVAPKGAVILGFFLKPNRFAYGEKFFTEEQAK